jgi:pimeloyl-ACP methyl ester carboxylesterase
LLHPERVRALVLISAQAGIDDPATLAGYRGLLDGWLSAGLTEQIATTIEHIALGPNWAGAPAWKEKWRAKTPANLVSAFEALAHRDDISDKIHSINVPTLVIHGNVDAAIPLARGQAMRDAIPDAEMVVVPGGHSINMTNSDPVNVAIQGFFERHHLAS